MYESTWETISKLHLNRKGGDESVICIIIIRVIAPNMEQLISKISQDEKHAFLPMKLMLKPDKINEYVCWY